MSARSRALARIRARQAERREHRAYERRATTKAAEARAAFEWTPIQVSTRRVVLQRRREGPRYRGRWGLWVTTQEYWPAAPGIQYRSLRALLGLTLWDVAAATGLRPSDVSAVERGRATVSSTRYRAALVGAPKLDADRYRELLGVDVDGSSR